MAVGKKNGGEKEGEGGLFHFTFQAPKRAKTSKKSSSQGKECSKCSYEADDDLRVS